MKLKSKAILTGLIAASVLNTAFADPNNPTIIRIAGAATYRPALTKAVEDVLISSGVNAYTAAYAGSARYRPNASIYKGKLNNGTQDDVLIKIYWTGDLAGVVDLALTPPAYGSKKLTRWINTSQVPTFPQPGATGSTTPNVVSLGNIQNWLDEGSPGSPVDASVTVSAASSSAQVLASTGSGATASNAILDAINNGDLIEAGDPSKAPSFGGIGIAAFQWTLGRYDTTFVNTGAPFTNITQQQALALLQGPVPLPFFTNVNGTSRSSLDKNKYVFAVGRSQDAGARTVPFAEAGFGFGNAPYQFQLKFTNNQQKQVDGLPTGGQNTAGTQIATVSGVFPWPQSWPLNTEPTIDWNLFGHSGYNLTSDLANALSAINPVQATSITPGGFNTNIDTGIPYPNSPYTPPAGISEYWFVGYNGTADAASTIGGTTLSYNGVAYTPAAVRNGQYSLWSYAHLYYLASQISGVKVTALDLISDKIFDIDAATDRNGVTYTPPTENTGAVGILLNAPSLPVLGARSVEGEPIFKQ